MLLFSRSRVARYWTGLGVRFRDFYLLLDLFSIFFIGVDDFVLNAVITVLAAFEIVHIIEVIFFV